MVIKCYIGNIEPALHRFLIPQHAGPIYVAFFHSSIGSSGDGAAQSRWRCPSALIKATQRIQMFYGLGLIPELIQPSRAEFSWYE